MRLQPIGRITPLDGVNLKPFLDNKTLCKNHSFFRLRAANTSPVRGWIFFLVLVQSGPKIPETFLLVRVAPKTMKYVGPTLLVLVRTSPRFSFIIGPGSSRS